MLLGGLLAYSVAKLCPYLQLVPKIYNNTLHFWTPRNIMGTICKKINWHPEFSQLIHYYLYPEMNVIHFTVRNFCKVSKSSWVVCQQSAPSSLQIILLELHIAKITLFITKTICSENKCILYGPFLKCRISAWLEFLHRHDLRRDFVSSLFVLGRVLRHFCNVLF